MKWQGILPFLVGWVKINNPDLARTSQPVIHSDESHWSLLQTLNTVSNDEIERFLPQVCNFALDSGLYNQRLSDYFESILINKCASCLPFGLRVCGLLKASEEPIVERLFSRDTPSEMKSERFQRFQHHIEEATCIGSTALTYEDHLSRRRYYYDYNDLLERLGRLGLDLRQSPVEKRSYHLRRAMEQCNAIIYDRMLSAGNCSHPINPNDPLAGHKIASWCPDIARHSLHLPLLHSRDKIQRIVRFVGSECTTLPSRDRCPYKVVVEVLTEDSHCDQDALFTQYDRHLEPNQYWNPGATLQDMLHLDEDPNYNSDSLTVSEYDVDTLASSPSISTVSGNGDATKEAALVRCSSPTVSVSDYQQEYDYRGGHTPSNNKDSSDPPPSPPPSSSSERGPLRVRPIRNLRPHSYTQRLGKTSSGTASAASPNADSTRITLANTAAPLIPVPTTAAAVATSPPLLNLHSPLFDLPMVESSGSSAVGVALPAVQARTISDLEAMLRTSSPFSHLPGWKVASFVVKTGDDVRKESLAMQLIEFMQEVFLSRGIDIYLKPYQITATGKQYGLIEYLEGTSSVDQIKKGRSGYGINGGGSSNGVCEGGGAGVGGNGYDANGVAAAASPKQISLTEHFQHCFGLPYDMTHERALKNFVRSLAGYSLVTYLLQVKDRHNANILLDREGHMIHIDYGFILGDSPGYNMNFESAPFKLTKEYLELMGGLESDYFREFRNLFVSGFFALKDKMEDMKAIVQAFYGDKRKGAAESLKFRLNFRNANEVEKLIWDSVDNWRTKQYDSYQQHANNIKM